MAIQITNRNNTIDLLFLGNGDKVSLDKDKLTLHKEGDYVIIKDGETDDLKEYKILYSDSSSPVAASASELFDTISGYLNAAEGGSSSSSFVNITCTETSTQALASGDASVGASMINLSTQDVYILMGSGTASATNHTVKLPSGGSAIYEMPYNYSGEVNVVFAGAGTGDLVITKFN